MDKIEKARDAARAMPPEDLWRMLRVLEHGAVTFAADGTAFVEAVVEVRLSPFWAPPR